MVNRPRFIRTSVDIRIAEASMFLILAHAASGKEEQALREFKRCEPRLIANNELELLARCQQSLGLNQR